ncbi:MAG: SDR family oxidoreductase [Myxococcaceae bacterium]|jgi:NAD(P)-dependent dehydrogenase (short-subunit alcohol dehydrogenase family)|nr:SDR family oxidoreductase [Myxococcaceae bacterium]
MKRLEKQVAVVTGASRGIGAAIAERLAADGAELVLHYSSGVDEVRALAGRLEAGGARVSLVQADLSRSDGVERFMAGLRAPRVDVLVNNAGVAPGAPFAETTPEVFDAMMQVNVRSLFFLTQAVLARMPDGGRIINVSSAVTRTHLPGLSAYSASKGFVDTLTLHLAGELARRRITVNAVAPGAIDTRMSAWIHGPGGKDMLNQIQALPGIGQPAHVAAAVAFLAGPDGAWTTGQVLDVSGGTKL